MRKKLYCRKSIVALALAVIICGGLFMNPAVAEAKKKSSGNSGYAEGDDIGFGMFDGVPLSWTILTYDDTTKEALVVSRKPLNSRSVTAYRASIAEMYRKNGTTAGYVRWSENYWRGWLNQVFYQQCFNEAEKAMILKTTLSEKDAQASLMNFYHDTSMDAAVAVEKKAKNSLSMSIYNSQTTTSDYIFFLSSDEFTSNKDKMKYETKLIWPLRTNAYDDPAQGLFGNDTDKLIYRFYYYAGDSIRPAMRVKLGEPDETDSSDTSDVDKIKASNSSKSTSTATSSSTTAASTTTKATTTAATTTKTKATSSVKYANNGTNTGNINLPDDSSYSMKNGATAQVAIDLEYLNSTEKNYTITYKSSDAAVFTVDSKGVITATGAGTASLTAKMKKSNGKVYTMSCRIDVS